MLTPEEEMQILKGALTQGYKGQVFKLIDQANLQKGQVAEEESQQEQGLKGSDGNTVMSFPETEGDFNTEGMQFPIDIRKYDREGNLVKSYNKVPPGIKALDMGEDEGTVVENPSQYKEGGYYEEGPIKRFDEFYKALTKAKKNNKYTFEFEGKTYNTKSEKPEEIQNHKEEKVKKYQTGGVDLNFGAEGNVNCGPTGSGCRGKEARLSLKPNFNMSYNTGTKDIGGSLGLGLQSYIGGWDTRGGAPTIEAGIRGEGSVNALTLDSPNPETHTNLIGSGKIGYTKRGTSGAHDWSSDNAGFNIGAYGDYDIANKSVKELGIYGGYGKIQGNLSYDLQNKTIGAGIGFRLKEGGLRKYQDGGVKEENKVPSGFGLQSEMYYMAKRALKPKPPFYKRGWTDKQIMEYLEHKKLLQKQAQGRGTYGHGEKGEIDAKKMKKWIKKNTKTKTINPTGIATKAAGPFVAAMLSPLEAGRGSTVVDPESGINKYTGEKEFTPFQKGGVRKYQKAGFDKDAFINQYLKEENTKTNTKKTSKNKGILSNTVSTTDGTKYYNKNGTPMNFDEKNTKIISDKKETIKYVKKSEKDITEFLTDPVKAGDAMGMTGIPIVSEAGDLISAGASTYRGNYADASLSLAGIAVPFAGGAALKAGKNIIKQAPSHSLYRVVDASGNVQAAKYGSHIPSTVTTGRRSGIQGDIQSNTSFDHISTTTDQKWLTEGKSNLFDRYGGKNPYVVKLQGHEGKIHQIAKNATSSDLAKIRPGSYTNMKVAGPQHQEIVSILGPKGGKVANVKGVMSKSQYMDALRLDPNFKFKKGGLRKYQAGNFKEKPKTLIESKPFFQYPQSVINTKRRKELKDAIDIVVSKEPKDKQENMKELLTTNFMENSMGHNPKAYNRSYTNSQASIDHIRVDDLFDERKDKDGKSQGYSNSQKRYFKRLEELGLPTDKAGFLKELSFDNPLAAIAAMRMTYGRSPKKIPSKENPEKMFTYYNDEYRKNNKITDLTKSKERFYEGYKMEFKKGGYRSKSCW